jgi:N-acetylglucosaminyldiphosphoundecaprenol N-acetyl-beta-D-mannosaminyltransferase
LDFLPSVFLKNVPQIDLMGISIHQITEAQCVELIIQALEQQLGGWVVTPNLDHLRRCSVDPEYAQAILKADLRVADGMPLIWASRLQRTPLPERVAGSNLIYSLSEAVGKRGRSLYLLGGDPGTADAAGQILQKRCPGLRIAGTHCPEYGFEKNPERIQQITDDLRQAKPNVVFVGLGSPKQEYLIQKFQMVLPQAWWLGVGISFSFVCGRVRRAPMWMQRCGLEWFHRLSGEPHRLARRYLAEDLPFILQLMKESLLQRSKG